MLNPFLRFWKNFCNFFGDFSFSSEGIYRVFANISGIMQGNFCDEFSNEWKWDFSQWFFPNSENEIFCNGFLMKVYKTHLDLFSRVNFSLFSRSLNCSNVPHLYIRLIMPYSSSSNASPHIGQFVTLSGRSNSSSQFRHDLITLSIWFSGYTRLKNLGDIVLLGF